MEEQTTRKGPVRLQKVPGGYKILRADNSIVTHGTDVAKGEVYADFLNSKLDDPAKPETL